jgi:hypothetical protein
MHGATFVLDAAFCSETLDASGIVIDIGRALTPPRGATLNYRNLDEVPEFKGTNTTTEFLTKPIFDRLASNARASELGRDGRRLKAIRVTLSGRTSRAWYEADLWQPLAVPGDLATRPVATPMTGTDCRSGRLGWQADLLNLGEGFPWTNDAYDRTVRFPPAIQSLSWSGARRPAGSGVTACRPQSAIGAGAPSARAGMGTVHPASRRVTRK